MKKLLRGLAKGVSRCYPFYSGCGTIANSAFYRSLSDENQLVETRLRDGSRIQVHLNDYVGRSLYFFGDLDPKISWICKRILRRGDTVVDVGANYGLITLQCAALVGHEGRVHAFEPQPDLAALIRSSCQLNNFPQVTVHELGLSNADADLPMTVPEHNRGMATVNPDIPGRAITIHLKHAGAYLTSIQKTPVRFMKIDVEGHEVEVFTGAKDWLESVRPEVIVFETEADSPVFESHPGVKLLNSMNYAFFGIPRVRLLMKLIPIQQGGNSATGFHDIVAIQRTSSFDQLMKELC